MSGSPERIMRRKNKSSVKVACLFWVPLLFLMISPALSVAGYAQEKSFMFYNAENLFDTIDCSLNDDEFLPSSPRRWDTYRYYSKLNNLFRVIVSANGWDLPPVIGLCEVENKGVLDDLLRFTYLSRHHYKAIFSDSKDSRGIGVAMLVDTSSFNIVDKKILFPLDETGEFMDTRSVLTIRLADKIDTITVIVTHWPSRWGGVAATNPLRERVASVIAAEIDSVIKQYGVAEKIIILGDLNSEPDDPAVTVALGATTCDSDSVRELLCNISRFNKESRFGSYKYRGTWSLFDQIIVSGSFINACSGYCVNKDSYRIFSDSFLLVPDETYNGFKPLRTWNGPVYQGGYSDHLPVLVTLTPLYPARE